MIAKYCIRKWGVKFIFLNNKFVSEWSQNDVLPGLKNSLHPNTTILKGFWTEILILKSYTVINFSSKVLVGHLHPRLMLITSFHSFYSFLEKNICPFLTQIEVIYLWNLLKSIALAAIYIVVLLTFCCSTIFKRKSIIMRASWSEHPIISLFLIYQSSLLEKHNISFFFFPIRTVQFLVLLGTSSRTLHANYSLVPNYIVFGPFYSDFILNRALKFLSRLSLSLYRPHFYMSLYNWGAPSLVKI